MEHAMKNSCDGKAGNDDGQSHGNCPSGFCYKSQSAWGASCNPNCLTPIPIC